MIQITVFWVGATANLNEPQWAVGFGHFLGLTIFKTKKDQDWLTNDGGEDDFKFTVKNYILLLHLL